MLSCCLHTEQSYSPLIIVGKWDLIQALAIDTAFNQRGAFFDRCFELHGILRSNPSHANMGPNPRDNTKI